MIGREGWVCFLSVLFCSVYFVLFCFISLASFREREGKGGGGWCASFD